LLLAERAICGCTGRSMFVCGLISGQSELADPHREAGISSMIIEGAARRN
jgi:hypothetical protein